MSNGTSYEVLARKYRPQSFSELTGQEHVSRTLQNAIDSGRVAHAFLFTGARGVGIGRPYIWGLSAFGQEGIERVLEILRAELTMTLKQMGTPSIREITAAMKEKGPNLTKSEWAV